MLNLFLLPIVKYLLELTNQKKIYIVLSILDLRDDLKGLELFKIIFTVSFVNAFVSQEMLCYWKMHRSLFDI